VVFSLVGFLSESARAQGIHVRDGFTIELGLGLGITHIIPDGGSSHNEIGLAPLSLSLGGFVTSNLAIMFRMAGTSYYPDVPGTDISVALLGFYGVHVQYWINDMLFVSGGPGLALYGINPWDNDSDLEGFGFGLRAGFSFANWENHSLRVSLELFPSFFENMTVMAEAINFEWQYF